MIEKHHAAKHSVPPGEKIPTATPTPQADEPTTEFIGTPQPRAAPNPPTGYTLARTINIQVYTATAKPPIYFLIDGSFSHYHSSEMGLAQDVRNRTHPPFPAAGPSLPWG